MIDLSDALNDVAISLANEALANFNLEVRETVIDGKSVNAVYLKGYDSGMLNVCRSNSLCVLTLEKLYKKRDK